VIYTYRHLVELVDGDEELIAELVERGMIVRGAAADDHVRVDVEQVLVVRTLWRELEVDWPGIELVLRLRGELAAARKRIAELEAADAERTRAR
jgi:hypothetical protein